MDTFNKSGNCILASINTKFGLQLSLRNPWSFLANIKCHYHSTAKGLPDSTRMKAQLTRIAWDEISNSVYVNTMKPSDAYTRR